jgi:hypothetical protein
VLPLHVVKLVNKGLGGAGPTLSRATYGRTPVAAAVAAAAVPVLFLLGAIHSSIKWVGSVLLTSLPVQARRPSKPVDADNARVPN